MSHGLGPKERRSIKEISLFRLHNKQLMVDSRKKETIIVLINASSVSREKTSYTVILADRLGQIENLFILICRE